MVAHVVGTLVFLGGLALLFGWLQRRWSAGPLAPRAWRDTVTDLMHAVVTPIVVRVVVWGTLALAAIVTALVSLGTLRLDRLRGGDGHGIRVARWLASQPLALQIVGVLLVADFIGYWVHRWMHRSRVWPVHAVHHSATRLDWLAAIRNHPLQDAIGVVLQGLPLILLGFDGRVVAAFAPAFLLYGLLLHANVRWDFGPLRYVLASPRFHRWHHSDEHGARGKNFAGLFPIFDVLFGTFYMPRDQMPRSFGTGDPTFPRGWFGQMLHPFRARRAGT